MARSRCPMCGATVDVANIQGTDDHVVLEVHTDASSDAPRYKVVRFAPLTVVRVGKGAVGDYLPSHRYDCPAQGAGHPAGRRGR